MEDNIEFNGYKLSRSWFNFCMENPEKIKPNHTALYFWAIETFNRFDWKKKVGLPTTHAMEVLGIKSYNTYISTLNDLVEFGFIIMVEKSKNQYSSNIIALSNFNKAHNKAIVKAIQKQSESTCESICSITKPINHKIYKLLNKEEGKNKNFFPPSLLEIKKEIEIKIFKTVNAESFFNFYESKNWYVGKNKMKSWQMALAGWESRNKEKLNQNLNNGKPNTTSGTKTGGFVFNASEAIETLTR